MVKKLINPTPRDPLREWHEWFAWFPITAKSSGYYKMGWAFFDGVEYRIWWRYVMRRRVSNSDGVWSIYAAY